MITRQSCIFIQLTENQIYISVFFCENFLVGGEGRGAVRCITFSSIPSEHSNNFVPATNKYLQILTESN